MRVCSDGRSLSGQKGALGGPLKSAVGFRRVGLWSVFWDGHRTTDGPMNERGACLRFCRERTSAVQAEACCASLLRWRVVSEMRTEQAVSSMKLVMGSMVDFFSIRAVLSVVRSFCECRGFCGTVIKISTRVEFYNAADRAILIELSTWYTTTFLCSAAVSARFWWSTGIPLPNAGCRI